METKENPKKTLIAATDIDAWTAVGSENQQTPRIEQRENAPTGDTLASVS